MKKKRLLSTALIAVLLLSAVGCGKSSEEEYSNIVEPISTEDASNAASSDSAAEASTEESAEIPEGMYLSELTGEPISNDIKDQRPIAAMVDNEKTALPHFGLNDADIVYEMMNSTANDRITRLMCVFKDWEKIEQVGSIRSTRPTNILLASEYDAVLCHDGGPFYNDQYFSKDWSCHFSGIFSRVNNGKSREFTEYIMTGDLDDAFSNSSYSTTYNEYAPEGCSESHFNFTDYGSTVDLSKTYDSTITAKEIDLPFKHNSSKLVYNEDTQTYDYYEYGSIHADGSTGDPLTFDNVIIQDCTFSQLDSNGYLIYNCIDSAQPGYYITKGLGKDIGWTKAGETDITKYYDSEGNEIKINTGKTYICLVPSDSWDSLVID